MQPPSDSDGLQPPSDSDGLQPSSQHIQCHHARLPLHRRAIAVEAKAARCDVALEREPDEDGADRFRRRAPIRSRDAGDRQTAHGTGARAHATVVERFEQDAQIDQLESFYEEAITVNAASEPVKSNLVAQLAPRFAEGLPAK